ncbi:MAG: hypothetical protein CVU42_08635 [Chloroflexi bacterium HGW-Chloroflexi-4]|jgi:hypothetical protein|nr:MAG: hypothetical protein CVU42_08635 [Chloroflexi bacterium HGW-Chloroflexi-4]
MSYQEKKTLASITSGALLLAAYCLYAFNPARTPADLKAWATTMLVFIAIGIGATIIIQIVFHILFSIGVAIQQKIQNNDCDDKDIEKNIKLEMVEDERDRMIEMKSNQVGFAVAGFGFVVALLSLVFNYSPVVMLNILFITFSFGSICEGIYQFLLYRRGYSHA